MQLSCEICNSNDLLKQEGIFRCQNCGTKYSTEEVKKLLNTQERATDDKSESDISKQIESYILLSQNAYDSGNEKEAEIYCNKIIELEPKHYLAWLVKGQAAGWQSTLNNIRIEEALNCFLKSFTYAPEDKLEDLMMFASKEIDQLTLTAFKKCCEAFSSEPTAEAASLIFDCGKLALTCQMRLAEIEVETADQGNKFASLINSAVVSAWKNNIVPTFKSYPTLSEFGEMIDKRNICLTLLEYSIRRSDDNSEKVIMYENIIHMIDQTLEFKCHVPGTSFMTGVDSKTRQDWLSLISDYRNKTNEIKEQIKQKETEEQIERNKVYWEANKNERVRLEKILVDSEAELKSLGLFAFKRRKEVEENLINARNELNRDR